MRRRFRRIAVLGVTGVVVAGGAGAAYATMSSPGPAYRLATATLAHTKATLHAVGTLTPVREADVAFPVGGSVATVAVKAGQHVTTGQKLGSLDTTSLQASLTAAKSTLASAEAKVSSDEASQNAAATPTASPTPSPTASPTASGGSAGASPTSSLQPLQQAVLNGQRTVDAALRQAQAALGQATKACASSPTASPATTGPQPSPGGSQAKCVGAEQQVVKTETTALKAQQTLSGQLTKLDKALSSAIAAAGRTSSSSGTSGHGSGGSGSGGSGSGGSGSGGSGSGGSGSGGSGSGGSGPVSAAQLAADQAQADADQAQVTAAQQNLAAATVVSPLSGTVVTVDVTSGKNTAAGSTAFVVAGLDTYEVVAAVDVADIPNVKVGQRASVAPDGMSTPLNGSVVSIGLVPTTSGSSATYPVTIGLTAHDSGLHTGGNASVTITTSQSSGVTVPTSAVHNFGAFAAVIADTDGKTQVTRVTVGTEGPVLTRITSGLKVGQQVVLANLNEPLPTSNQTGRFGGPRIGVLGGGPQGRVVRVAGGG